MKISVCIQFLIALTALVVASSTAWTDDAVPAVNEKSTEKQSKEPMPEEPTEKSLLEKIGDELLKKGEGARDADPKTGEGVDKLDRAVKGMRSAGNNLDEGLTADETQKIQKQVIKDLDDIINQLENPPPNQGGGGGGGGGGKGGGASNRNRNGGRGGAQSRLRRPQGTGSKNMPAGQQESPENSEEKSDEQAGDKGTDSSKKAQAERKAAEEAARRRKLEMDIWGHLPAHLREEFLSTYGDRMLPKYEHLVKQFYEALSTQGNPKSK